jgi:hypothetical protein
MPVRVVDVNSARTLGSDPRVTSVEKYPGATDSSAVWKVAGRGMPVPFETAVGVEDGIIPTTPAPGHPGPFRCVTLKKLIVPDDAFAPIVYPPDPL